MTEPSPPQLPDDDQLQQYLAGDAALSRGYRDASREITPPDLDRAVLDMARAAVPRRRRTSRWSLPLALAATLLIGVPLAWNVTRQAPRMDAQTVARAPEAERALPVEPPAASSVMADAARATRSDTGGMTAEAVVARQAKAAPQPRAPSGAPAPALQRAAPDAMAEVAAAAPPEAVDAVVAGAAQPGVAMQSLMAPPPVAEADAPAERRSGALQWGVPEAWTVVQSPDGGYQVGVDFGAPYAGAASAVLRGEVGRGWAELRQDLPVASFRGLRLRLRGFLRSDLRHGLAQLVLRTGSAAAVSVAGQIDADGTVLIGVRDWRRVDVVVDVPADADALSVGILLQDANGDVHVDQLSLVAVPPGLAAEDADRAGGPVLPQPRNPGFEAADAPSVDRQP